jgi:hypothetical protein
LLNSSFSNFVLQKTKKCDLLIKINANLNQKFVMSNLQTQNKTLTFQASMYHSLLSSLPNGYLITRLFSNLNTQTFKEACEYIWENAIDSLFLACNEEVKEEITRLNDLNKSDEIQEILAKLIVIEPYYLEVMGNAIKQGTKVIAKENNLNID